MLEYTLSNKMRSKFAEDHGAVKSALSKIANAKFNKDVKPRGIGRYEGGVYVNNKEVKIGNYYVAARNLANDPTEEEIALVEAIDEVCTYIKTKGIKALREEYGVCKSGDNLNELAKTR